MPINYMALTGWDYARIGGGALGAVILLFTILITLSERSRHARHSRRPRSRAIYAWYALRGRAEDVRVDLMLAARWLRRKGRRDHAARVVVVSVWRQADPEITALVDRARAVLSRCT